jgi:hypothetical protein
MHQQLLWFERLVSAATRAGAARLAKAVARIVKEASRRTAHFPLSNSHAIEFQVCKRRFAPFFQWFASQGDCEALNPCGGRIKTGHPSEMAAHCRVFRQALNKISLISDVLTLSPLGYTVSHGLSYTKRNPAFRPP